ncbi:MAG: phosphoribosyltransferase family protein [bacterium]
MFLIIRKILSTIIEAIYPTTPLIGKILDLEPSELLKLIPCASVINDKNFIAIISYKNPLTRTAIWEMKYRGHRGITKKMAAIMYDFLIIELSEATTWQNFLNPIIVPIPITKKRLAERGFNQAIRLAEELYRLDNGTNFTTNSCNFVKTKNTERQSHTHGRTERLKNLEDSFEVINPADFAGRNIILLDDVITTGATMKEAKKTLKKAGAKKIICLALAH